MLLPSLILLWHGFAATLGVHADQKWAEAVSASAVHGIDITQPAPRAPEVRDEDNFLAHPYLKRFSFDKQGRQVTRLQELGNLLKPFMPFDIANPESNLEIDFLSVIEKLVQFKPSLRPLVRHAGTESPPARTVLTLTEKLGIPWQQLAKAALLPQSQFPPPGAFPADDDFSAPENAQNLPAGLLQFNHIIRLRTLAALKSAKPGTALECMKIQNKLLVGLLSHKSLLYSIFSNLFSNVIVAEAREGFKTQAWTDSDIIWLGNWANSIDPLSILRDGMANELFFGFNEITHQQKHPDAADHQFQRVFEIIGADAMRDTFTQTGLPFGFPQLAFLRGHSEFLYRLARPAAFLQWKASCALSICQDHLDLLRNGGLLEYSWPKSPRQLESKVVSYQSIGINFLRTQSLLNLLRTSIALQQWRAARGDFPNVLEALQPALPFQAQLDPFSGKPLIYRHLSEKSYRLYSIGGDRQDDGGVPLQDKIGDLVWNFGQ